MDSICHFVVQDGVHKHCYTVFRQNLEKKRIKRMFLINIRTSCGGISKVWLLISIFSYVSTHGIMKNTPGPRAPPDRRRPSRKITALSYSWITLIQKNIEMGKVHTMRRMEMMVKKTEVQLLHMSVSPVASSFLSDTILLRFTIGII